MPAMKTDQDHITDWILGGPTTDANLHPACRHDHRARHEGGWHVTSPEPGVIVWHSPLGHYYTVTPPPIISRLPDPQPRDWPHIPYNTDPYGHDVGEPTMPEPPLADPPLSETETVDQPARTPPDPDDDVCPF
jgi:hypothetical protein